MAEPNKPKPKRINYKAVLITLLVCVSAAVIFLAGLWSADYGRMAGAEEGPDAASSAYGSAEETGTASGFDLSVWVAYWDWEQGLNDVNSIIGMPDSVQAYAASFDAEDRLFLTDEAEEMVLEFGTVREDHSGLPLYLTIANDRMDQNGEWTENDSVLMDRLMRSAASRTDNIDDIVAMAQSSGFDGVELDYENISGKSLSGFAQFCSALYGRLQEEGMELRIVLRLGTSLPDEGLPEGPEYVMIAHDFYGLGSQPGPNADEPFLRNLTARMEDVPGEKRIAFATGGYDWDAGGTAQHLTEKEAYDLSLLSQDIQRDVNSGELYFTYAAEDGSVHTVWYADAETLAGWMDLSRSLGYGRFALWRMGGLMPDTLKMLSNLNGAVVLD